MSAHLFAGLWLAGALAVAADTPPPSPASASASTPTPASPQTGTRAAATVDVDAFVRRDVFERIKISPTGTWLAATVPMDDRTVLVVMRREDKAITAKVHFGEDTVVDDFWWVSDDRVLAAEAERFGRNDEPWPTGQLAAIDADGKRPERLTSREDSTFSLLYDTLPADDRNVLIEATPYEKLSESWLDRLDVYTGRRTTIATAPVSNATFTIDAEGVARFARGYNNDNISKLYYRDRRGDPWRLINDEAVSGVVESAIGFSKDGSTAYLRVERRQGPDAIVAWTPGTDRRTELLADPRVDPSSVIWSIDSDTPAGVRYVHDGERTVFLDPQSMTAKQQRLLEKAFPGQTVDITSWTKDGRLLLAYIHGDRSPGDFYLYDTGTRKAELLVSRREWLDPTRMAALRSVEIRARDGLMLHGYLALPPDAPQTGLPMVVLPHGGPFGLYDEWSFDDDTQLLTQAGYAVLRVNFRGSGNYGRAFQSAGAREWGGRMQDDLTDATRWAIAQGVADPQRICIYGASYGGYAALMGVAKEPGLYRCAVGYVGVYDLEKLHKDGARRARSSRTWMTDWVGERGTLASISPVTLADRIKVPVFLAAGGKDLRAPIEHSERMEKALRTAGVPVETLYYPHEGHGFYDEAHRREFYVRLLAFLSKHMGSATAR